MRIASGGGTRGGGRRKEESLLLSSPIFSPFSVSTLSLFFLFPPSYCEIMATISIINSSALCVVCCCNILYLIGQQTRNNNFPLFPPKQSPYLPDCFFRTSPPGHANIHVTPWAGAIHHINAHFHGKDGRKEIGSESTRVPQCMVRVVVFLPACFSYTIGTGFDNMLFCTEPTYKKNNILDIPFYVHSQGK